MPDDPGTTLPSPPDGAPFAAPAHAASAPRPELVQLLTPEGERVEHPDYDLDLSDEEYRALYRDLVLTRRVDLEATALQPPSIASLTMFSGSK